VRLVTYCKALGDPSRVRLMHVLLRHELNVGEIVQALGLGQSRVSRHLKVLVDSGLLELRREGLWSYYRAAEQGEGRAFLNAALPLLAHEPDLARDLEEAAAVVRERATATRRFFDAIAPEWDRLQRDVLGDFDLGGAILARMPKNATAADLGCGTGELLARLASKAMKAIGVDNSPRMLEIAAKRFRGNNAVSLRIGELTHLPLRDWEADFAVLSMVLHHLDQPAQALTEAARVLKFDGRLLVADFDEHAEEDMRASYGDHRLGFSRETMLQWLAQARFEVRSVERFPVNRGLAVMLYEAVKK
jgi:ArsR family transcriptional regulator